MPVTRKQIVRYVGTAFIGGGARRLDLIALAKVNAAPSEVLHALQRLPERYFRYIDEVVDVVLPEADRPNLAA